MCIALLVTPDQKSVDTLNWHLSKGYGIVDRIELVGATIIVLKQP